MLTHRGLLRSVEDSDASSGATVLALGPLGGGGGALVPAVAGAAVVDHLEDKHASADLQQHEPAAVVEHTAIRAAAEDTARARTGAGTTAVGAGGSTSPAVHAIFHRVACGVTCFAAYGRRHLARRARTWGRRRWTSRIRLLFLILIVGQCQHFPSVGTPSSDGYGGTSTYKT
jgi:hypothetical protein